MRGTKGAVPRATIHKRILDEAAEHRSMSMEAIADAVGGATVDLVASVLDEYGDPAERTAGDPVDVDARNNVSREAPAEPLAATDAGGEGEPAADDADTANTTDTADDDGTVESAAGGDGGAPGTAADVDRANSAAPPDSSDRVDRIDDGSASEPPRRDGGPVDADDADTEGGTERPTVADPSASEGADDVGESGGSAGTSGTTTLDESAEPAESDAQGALDEPDEAAATPDPDGDASAGAGPAVPSVGALTPEQRETVEAIRRRPRATQAEIAEELGVSRAAVSVRAAQVPGLEWRAREAFVARLFEGADDDREDAGPSGVDDERDRDGRVVAGDGGGGDAEDGGGPGEHEGEGGGTVDTVDTAAAADPGGDDGNGAGDRTADRLTALETAVGDLAGRVGRLDDRLDGLDPGDRAPAAPLLDDPALVHKLVRLCVSDDRFSEEEERRVIEALLGAGR